MAVTVSSSTPAITLVSVAEAKSHLRVTHTAEDALITALIQTAVDYAQRATGRWFLTTTLVLRLEDFPPYDAWPQRMTPYWPRVCGHSPIKLPGGKLQSITSVQYKDAAGATQTLSSPNYELVSDKTPAEIWPALGKTWPQTYGSQQDVTITYVVGETDASNVSPCIRAAVLLILSDLYTNRNNSSVTQLYQTPFSAQALLAGHCIENADWGV